MLQIRQNKATAYPECTYIMNTPWKGRKTTMTLNILCYFFLILPLHLPYSPYAHLIAESSVRGF